MVVFEGTRAADFAAIRLKLASPDIVRHWSYGEVTKPETVNYRTQKPEKEGLFSERIFGPSKDWECYCGKYKKIRYKGIVCDKCGVEVTRSIVRRERMGHITLMAPVTHIWFLRGISSKIGLILDLPATAMEKVVYFANFIITDVDDELKKATLEQIKQEFKNKKKQIENEFAKKKFELKQTEDKPSFASASADKPSALEQWEKAKTEKTEKLEEALKIAQDELKEIKPRAILSEHQYQNLALKYGHIFEAGIGAEAIFKLLQRLDMPKLVKEL